LTDIRVTRNGTSFPVVTAAADGSFSVSGINLIEGNNDIAAFAEDSIGISPRSPLVTVILDSGAPGAPTLNEALQRAGGLGVRLLWQAPASGEVPASYDVYRSTGPFSSTASATRVVQGVTTTNAVDTGVTDGTYYYSVVAVDAAGNDSVLSNQLVVNYDATPPAFSVSYDSASPVGVQTLGVTLTVTEPLMTTPSLIFIAGGSNTPMAVPLSLQNSTTYTGSFNVTSSMASGPVSVQVSGRDLAGNIYSGLPTGPSLVFDTAGPSGSVTTVPVGPVRIDSPFSVQVTLTLDEPVRNGTQPLLRFAPPTGPPIVVSISGSGTGWSGTLNLGPGMGTGFGGFDLTVEDALGNIGSTITSGQQLEVYDAALPPPANPPAALTGTALPGGAVDLSWQAEVLAQTYTMYRSAGDCTTAPTTLVQSGITGTLYTDTPPGDGLYCYGVTSERLGAISGLMRC
jgi:hypothetical protein